MGCATHPTSLLHLYLNIWIINNFLLNQSVPTSTKWFPLIFAQKSRKLGAREDEEGVMPSWERMNVKRFICVTHLSLPLKSDCSKVVVITPRPLSSSVYTISLHFFLHCYFSIIAKIKGLRTAYMTSSEDITVKIFDEKRNWVESCLCEYWRYTRLPTLYNTMLS